MKVLNYLYAPEYIFNNVLSNYKFYADKVKVKDNLNSFSCNIGKTFEGFVSSTPSIISTAAASASSENYLVNVRYVNYHIDENGNYVNQENIITHNMIAILDKATKEVQHEFLLEYDTSHDGRYIGLEDVRLYADPMDSTRIRYTANRGIGEGGKMHVETGRIEFEFETDPVTQTQTNKIKTVRTANSVILESPENRDIEKNWVLFPTGCLETKCVYTWWPLVIGDLSNRSFVETHRYASAPSCLKHVRGSTNGVLIDDEIWFLCHTVSYENRRYYYHLWVILDSGNYGVKRLSPFFTFEGEKVEYALGLMYEKDTDELIVGYSVLDKTTQFLVLDKKSLVF